MTFTFGDFVLDCDQRRLAAASGDVHLQPKAFALLKALIDARPRALSKDEILATVWPGTFVNENNLATVVRDLRDALGDDAHTPQFIRTVYGFGYAFAAEALASGPGPAVAASAWRLLHEHREIRLSEGATILGRTGSDVTIVDAPTVSRHHALVRVTGAHATIEDLGSKNGTWIGTTRVTGATALQHGVEVRLGAVALRARFATESPSTETSG